MIDRLHYACIWLGAFLACFAKHTLAVITILLMAPGVFFMMCGFLYEEICYSLGKKR